jgi:hypothetical protein
MVQSAVNLTMPVRAQRYRLSSKKGPKPTRITQEQAQQNFLQMFKEKHSDDPVNAKLMCMLYGKIPMQVVSNEDKEEAEM